MITLADATTILREGLAAATSKGVPPLTMVVLDASGDLVAAHRQDGASMFRLEVALGKAWGSVAMGVSSRTLASRAKDNLPFFLGLAATAQGRLLAQPGAALIRDRDGVVVGAAGASGGTGDQDEACCVHGIVKAGFAADVT